MTTDAERHSHVQAYTRARSLYDREIATRTPLTRHCVPDVQEVYVRETDGLAQPFGERLAASSSEVENHVDHQ